MFDTASTRGFQVNEVAEPPTSTDSPRQPLRVFERFQKNYDPAMMSRKRKVCNRGPRVLTAILVALVLDLFVVTVRFQTLLAWPIQAAPQTMTSVEHAVRDAYRNVFAESIERPAIVNDLRSVDCAGNGHLTTTAYLRASKATSDLLTIYTSRDGTEVARQSRSRVLTPAGTFRVLVVLVRYSATIDAHALAELENAQKQINEDHAAFARSRGFPAPIVRFENTNLVLEPNVAGESTPARSFEPRSGFSVASAAMKRGYVTTDYQIIMSIDIDPGRSAGGFSLDSERHRFIYVGNYLQRTTPMTAYDWRNVARTAYHHEMAHQWGWPSTHDWAPTCGGTSLGFEPFIVPPLLFGWEDVDGDGTPEILDETPYGRSNR